jgi:hypothetical protein
MKEEDVTIKAHELDRLLRLALLGKRMSSRDEALRLPAAAVERLQYLNASDVRERARPTHSPRNDDDGEGFQY